MYSNSWNSSPEISKRMANIKTKHNKYEKKLAKHLWKKGYRYKLNYRTLPGSPDIAIVKYRIAIFVDGEFWHGKDFEKRKKHIHKNHDLWVSKIQSNIARDIKNDCELKIMGWIPIHFWTKDIEDNIEYCVTVIEDFIDYQEQGVCKDVCL